MNATKVSLCLPGNYSPETFRFFESLKTGCIVLSAAMPQNGLYRSHPGLRADRITDVDSVARNLVTILHAPEKFDAMQQDSLRQWESYYAPSAVAELIRQIVASEDSRAPHYRRSGSVR